MTGKTVAQTIVETLRDLGVRHIFGVPSGGWVDYMEAIRQTDGIEFILTSHEGGAGFMAAVCGGLTGVPGVCFGTFGPGATNLATGVGCAQLDRWPLIALTDEMPDEMRERVTQMGIDHQALFAPITKWTTRLSAENASDIMADAARVALSDVPGAVHVGMPVNVSALTALPASGKTETPKAPRLAKDQHIALAADKIAAAEYPVLAVGLGASRAGIRSEIVRFAELHNMPVVLTPMAKGMMAEDHPLYAGVLFHALSNQVAMTHRDADLIVAVGYDPVEFNFEMWMSNIVLININNSPLDIDHTEYTDTLDLNGDIARNFARLSQCPPCHSKWDIDALVARKNSMFEQMSPQSNRMGPCEVLDVLRKVLPEDGIMTCDVGAHTHLIGQKWHTPSPGTQIMSNGWSSMGFGLPAAIGAKLTTPETSVCTVVGDGGFLMAAGELATAIRYNLNIVIIVLSDNDLALIRIKQQRKDNPVYGTPIREASGSIGGDNIFGVPVFKADHVEQLEQQLEKSFGADGPVIVEALVDSKQYDQLVLKKDKT
jgi:acetolactate synthase-1/2/3 large subunit